MNLQKLDLEKNVWITKRL